ncbi:sperm-associated antigen 1-like [Plakobranchus ocellatus]|uniref:Sperm-associated antigen 1-like n=1 Tax=Plakobranchus ocellatus TaxID=259542 RepID=A0AAV4D1C3_9GAST|nr:sperm-associated antigen 1-like [Plakobranchus ocellatus]
MPRDYKEWDKVDIDAELEKLDNSETKKEATKRKDHHLIPQIDTAGLTEEEKERKANREKDKGNEAFRSHDFEESVTYYSRSISLMPNAASFNNRALAYLKLESWDKAIKDCNKVLSFEADNIKALLRRGTAFKSKKDFKKAVADFDKVLAMEPNNKKAEALLSECQKELELEEKTRQEKGGRRMVIEEVESEDDEEDLEHIEAEKPLINGHSERKETESNPVLNMVSSDVATSSQTSNPSEVDQNELPPSCSSSQESATAALLSGETEECWNDTQTQCSSLESLNKPSPMVSDTDNTDPSALPSSAEVLPLTESSTPDIASSPKTQTPSSAPLQPESTTQTTSEQDSNLNHFIRPKFIQKFLPPDVQRLKDEGNQLFRSGQYGDAMTHYSTAISALEKETDQKVHLSVLLSNRAACHLKTGNCVEAVKDCKMSLQYVPHSLKPILRRAAAYEALERYADAYVDYKHAISIDKSADQAHQGASRCQSSLQTMHGAKTWREKIPPLVLVQPWEIPIIEDEAGLHRSMSSSISLSGQCTEKPAAAESQKVSSPQQLASTETGVTLATSSKSKLTPESSEMKTSSDEDFEDVKARGNLFVQKGQYAEAIDCYNKCIALKPDQVASYTNRALCYLKLNQANEAATDCERALQMEPKNPKALYRRALARKMSHQYKLSLQDLVELLKLEPRNTAAQKEMDMVKKVYKEELEKLKQKKVTENETKVRKRMKIEEVDDDEDDDKPARGKGSEKSKSQNKSRVLSGSKSKSSNGRVSNGSSQFPETSSAQDQQVAPPIAPRLMKTTPYEFCQAWNSLKPCQGVQPYAEILKQLSPADLPSVISNKLDGQMLQIIVKCVHEEMVLKGENDRGYEILNNLCEVPRFSTVSMFMSGKEKKEVSSVLAILSKTPSSAYSSSDIARLKSRYSVK